jgi:hypothetical protein
VDDEPIDIFLKRAGSGWVAECPEFRSSASGGTEDEAIQQLQAELLNPPPAQPLPEFPGFPPEHVRLVHQELQDEHEKVERFARYVRRRSEQAGFNVIRR